MVEQPNKPSRIGQGEELGEGLRQALLRLTSPHYSTLQDEIESLRKQISGFESLLGEIKQIQENLAQRDQELNHQDQELQALVEEAKASLNKLEARFTEINQSLAEDIRANESILKNELAVLQAHVYNPQEVSKRVGPVLIPLISESVSQDQDEFAEAVAPVIGPAIRHQIREAKQDIIDALFPLIGEIIGKAISESIRELTRKIDARLRRQLDFRSRLQILFARMRGVSEAELLMRDALPYTIYHVFLIHRQSGLLLQHIPVSEDQAQDTDLISGMLTAIRDFVRDSFGEGVGDLEEIAYGDERILLESGQYAYLAVVLDGVEPAGYNQLMRDVVGQIHLHHDESLRKFDGDMERLPDFRKALSPITTTLPVESDSRLEQEQLSRRQKLLILGAAIGILALVGLLIFACIFTIRLWPLAFPASIPIPTATMTPSPSLTSNQTAALSLTPTIAAILMPSRTPTSTQSPSPTSTFTPEPTITPNETIGTLTGNLYVRQGPSIDFPTIDTLLAGEQVRILQQQDDWYFIQWPIIGEHTLEGWVWNGMVLLNK